MTRVLVVDDDTAICDVMAHLLTRVGVPATSAGGGEEALRFLKTDLPQLVLLDVMMPGMDGIEVLRRIRNDERTSNLPVVMFTASNESSFKTLAREYGANDYWVKGSIPIDEILKRVRGLVQN